MSDSAPPLPPASDLSQSLLPRPSQQSVSGPDSLSTPAPVATGLTTGQAAARLDFWGPNALEEKKSNACLKFLGYFWGPMPITIWLASIIELINESIPDLCILLLLQLINGLVGWVEEKVRDCEGRKISWSERRGTSRGVDVR